MDPGELIAFISVVVIPALLVMYIASRFFRLRERKLEIEAQNAAEKAAQYASHSRDVEDRLQVLERILTDGGLQTAAQIEALRTDQVGKTERLLGQCKSAFEPSNTALTRG